MLPVWLLLAIGVPVIVVFLLIGCLQCLKRKPPFKHFVNEDSISEARTNEGYTTDLSSDLNVSSSSEIQIDPLPDIISEASLRKPRIGCVDKTKLDIALKLIATNRSFPRRQLTYLKEIGSGWFGQIIESDADHILSGVPRSRVVVKMLKDDASKAEQKVFLEDVAPFRELEHVNILRLFGQCTETTPHLAILEFAQMGDLKTYLRKHKPGVKSIQHHQILKFAIDAASGLACLHRHGFIHHDLAARSCVVCADHTLKVGDYGITEEQFPEDYFPSHKEMLPVRWMAPESLSHQGEVWQTAVITKEANIWSFGVLLWEVLTFAAQPYTDLTNEMVLQLVVEDRVVKLTKPDLNIAFMDRLYEVMQFCWLNPGQRPTITEAHALLEQLFNKMSAPQAKDSAFEEKWNRIIPSEARVVSVNNKPKSLRSKADSFDTDFVPTTDSVLVSIEHSDVPETKKVDAKSSSDIDSSTKVSSPDLISSEDSVLVSIELGDVPETKKRDAKPPLKIDSSTKVGDLGSTKDSVLVLIEHNDVPEAKKRDAKPPLDIDSSTKVGDLGSTKDSVLVSIENNDVPEAKKRDTKPPLDIDSSITAPGADLVSESTDFEKLSTSVVSGQHATVDMPSMDFDQIALPVKTLLPGHLTSTPVEKPSQEKLAHSSASHANKQKSLNFDTAKSKAKNSEQKLLDIEVETTTETSEYVTANSSLANTKSTQPSESDFDFGEMVGEESVIESGGPVSELRDTTMLTDQPDKLQSTSPSKSFSPSTQCLSPSNQSLSPSAQSFSSSDQSLSPFARSVSPSNQSLSSSDRSISPFAQSLSPSAKSTTLSVHSADPEEFLSIVDSFVSVVNTSNASDSLPQSDQSTMDVLLTADETSKEQTLSDDSFETITKTKSLDDIGDHKAEETVQSEPFAKIIPTDDASVEEFGDFVFEPPIKKEVKTSEIPQTSAVSAECQQNGLDLSKVDTEPLIETVDVLNHNPSVNTSDELKTNSLADPDSIPTLEGSAEEPAAQGVDSFLDVKNLESMTILDVNQSAHKDVQSDLSPLLDFQQTQSPVNTVMSLKTKENDQTVTSSQSDIQHTGQLDVSQLLNTPSDTVDISPVIPDISASLNTDITDISPVIPDISASLNTPSDTVEISPIIPDLSASLNIPSDTVDISPVIPDISTSLNTPSDTVDINPVIPDISASLNTPSDKIDIRSVIPEISASLNTTAPDTSGQIDSSTEPNLSTVQLDSSDVGNTGQTDQGNAEANISNILDIGQTDNTLQSDGSNILDFGQTDNIVQSDGSNILDIGQTADLSNILDFGQTDKSNVQSDTPTLLDFGSIDRSNVQPDMSNLLDSGQMEKSTLQPDMSPLLDIGQTDQSGIKPDTSSLLDIGQTDQSGIKPDTSSLLDIGQTDQSGIKPDTSSLLDIGQTDQSGIKPDTSSLLDIGQTDQSGRKPDISPILDIGQTDRSGIKPDTSSLLDIGQTDQSGIKPDTSSLLDIGQTDQSGIKPDTSSLLDIGQTDQSGIKPDTSSLLDIGQTDQSGIKPDTSSLLDIEPTDQSGIKPDISPLLDIGQTDQSGIKPDISSLLDIESTDQSGIKSDISSLLDIEPTDQSGIKPDISSLLDIEPTDQNGLKPDLTLFETGQPDLGNAQIDLFDIGQSVETTGNPDLLNMNTGQTDKVSTLSDLNQGKEDSKESDCVNSARNDPGTTSNLLDF